MEPTPEKLWLVNEKDEPVQEGWQWRSVDNWRNFRVVNAFIRNTKGELWIPRRASTKKLFPLCLDMSVGGHVTYGESYEESFERETLEEVGIDIAKTGCVLLGHFSPFEHNLSAWMKVWEIRADEVPLWNQSDFTEWIWIAPEALRQRIHDGEKVKRDLLQLIDLAYPAVKV